MRVRALIKKEFWERRASFSEDKAGAFLRILLWTGIALAFAFFFEKFAGIYLKLGDSGERLFELMTISLSLLFLSLVAGGVSSLVRALSPELALFMAMPFGGGTILFARLVLLYFGQIGFSLASVLLFGVTLSHILPLGSAFWGSLILSAFVLPLVSSAFSAALALPWRALLSFFATRFALMLAAVTSALAVGFWGYTRLLFAVKELLLGDDLKYFFSEELLRGIGRATRFLFPANLFGLLAGDGGWKELVTILLLSLSCVLLAFFLLGAALKSFRAKKLVASGHRRAKRAPGGHGVFYALFKKEFLEVFRSPSYAFSCFSVALVLPLMVWSCMTVGSSLVKRLVGIGLDFELSLFLLLLFGALTNAFCSTNVSREGELFLSGKGLPVRCGQVFGAKILFCLSVNALSEGATAAVLWGTKYLAAGEALLLFAVGLMFSLAQICFATRCDLVHARFSPMEEVRESGGTASACILFGLSLALSGGGGALLLRLLSVLRFQRPLRFASFALAGGICTVAAAGSAFYLLYGLKRRYLAAGGKV